MDITTKGSGRKTYSMVTVCKNTQIKISIKVDLCAEASLGKDSINSQMASITKGHFIMA